MTDIVKETSVIEPTQGTEKTAFLSSLLLLVYGKEFANIDPKTKKEIRIARKNAVEEYVNKKIVAISEKKKVLEEQLALFDGIDVEEKIQEIIDSIKTTEEKYRQQLPQVKRYLDRYWNFKSKQLNAIFFKKDMLPLEVSMFQT